MEALREMSNARAVPLAKLGVEPRRVAEVAALVEAGKVAKKKETAAAIITRLAERGDVSAEQAAADLGLVQSGDTSAIDTAIDALIAQNPKGLQEYRAGKQAALNSLMGMVMKSAKGLDAATVRKRLEERLRA
jgi:aspartyl-tRNA(Asn)/glutamyl-tRNA(Gln) amidotransferase subunit B